MGGHELRVPEERPLEPDAVLVRRARLAICHYATDETDARELMAMVGIGPNQKWSV